MSRKIEAGFMAFVSDGSEKIGAVREVSNEALVIFVENAGEFVVPLSAVTDVHFQKVILNPRFLDTALLKAVTHAHDREDPNISG
jgi:hypothetical protein